MRKCILNKYTGMKHCKNCLYLASRQLLVQSQQQKYWGKVCKSSKFTIKTLERPQWRPSAVFIVNFEHTSHLVPAILLKEFDGFLSTRYIFYIVCKDGSMTAKTSKMELFVIIANGFQPLTIITKCSILDVAAVLDPPLVWIDRRWGFMFPFRFDRDFHLKFHVIHLPSCKIIDWLFRLLFL